MKKKEDQITELNYYDWMAIIGKDLVQYIINGLQEEYTASYIIKSEYSELAGNFLPITFYFDIYHNVMYVYYELDKDRTIACRTPDRVLYNRIYNRVMQINKEYEIMVQIVGYPTSKQIFSNYKSNPLVDIENKILRPSTIALWDVSPRGYLKPYFLESVGMLYDSIRKNYVSDENVGKYLNEVLELNKNLVLHGPNNTRVEVFEDAFEQFNVIYKKYFGDTLPRYEDVKTFNIYVDVIHDQEQERLDPEIHKTGHIYNLDRVPEIILAQNPFNNRGSSKKSVVTNEGDDTDGI